MAILQFESIGIKAIAGAIPHKKIINLRYTDVFSENEVREIVEKTGIIERRFADENTCSSDLCYVAANELLKNNIVSKDEIDLLVFISQTPDFRMPATSFLLQERLGLKKGTMVFDVNLGCSGFIYGLGIIYSFLQNKNFTTALLLNGETRSKVYSPKDRRTAFLFGDGGVATLITKDKKYGKSFFSFNSDGSRADLIKINAGGYRIPSSIETVKERIIDEYGNIRTEEQGYMDGADVFNFVIREVPKDIKNVLTVAKKDKEDIDYFIFHQANGFINDYLAKKLKLNKESVLNSLEKFGNTSSVSIPLTILDNKSKSMAKGNESILLSAFGVGMSWASAIINLSDTDLLELVEVENGDILENYDKV